MTINSMARWNLLLFFGFLIFCSFPVSAKILTAGGVVDSIDVFSGKKLNQPFLVVGQVRVTSYMQKDLIPEIRKLCAKYGGHAVLGYETQRSETQVPSGVQTINVGEYQATGVVIRYDPQGITELNRNDTIKVLQ